MVNNKNQSQQGLKDPRREPQADANKTKTPATPQQEQEDTRKKGDQTASSRRDQSKK